MLKIVSKSFSLFKNTYKYYNAKIIKLLLLMKLDLELPHFENMDIHKKVNHAD
jgi:hypothetical protein